MVKRSKHNFYLSVYRLEVNLKTFQLFPLYNSKASTMKIQFAMLLLVSLSLGSCKNDIKTPPEASTRKSCDYC